MTIVRIDLVGAALDTDAKAELSRRVISAFCEVEVGRDTDLAHGGFIVHVNETDAGSVFMGNGAMVEASSTGRAAIITIQVMAGPWTDAMKADIFKSLEPIVREIADMPRSGIGADVWMTITEVPEGGWSVGGRPVSISRIAPLFDEERQQRILDYMDARRA